MKQSSGFALMRHMNDLLESYEDSSFACDNRDLLSQLRNATPYLDPHAYRGILRDPLAPFPSSDPKIQDLLSSPSDASYSKAREYFYRVSIISNPEYAKDDSLDEDLVESLEEAQKIRLLLENPDEFEIVFLSRKPFDFRFHTLGYDIGYWGGDHYSIICDTAIMLRWHPPSPIDFKELSEMVRPLNEHALFNSEQDAKEFRNYYLSQSWGETEDVQGEFTIIKVELPDQ